MTEEEKAKELVNKFTKKEHALICVQEIENALIDCGELSDQLQNMDRELNFWENVRKAIKML